jgi:hypothetical protein
MGEGAAERECGGGRRPPDCLPKPVFADCLLVEVDACDKYGVPPRYARATAAAGAATARPGLIGQAKLDVVSVIFRLHSEVALEFWTTLGGTSWEKRG